MKDPSFSTPSRSSYTLNSSFCSLSSAKELRLAMSKCVDAAEMFFFLFWKTNTLLGCSLNNRHVFMWRRVCCKLPWHLYTNYCVLLLTEVGKNTWLIPSWESIQVFTKWEHLSATVHKIVICLANACIPTVRASINCYQDLPFSCAKWYSMRLLRRSCHKCHFATHVKIATYALHYRCRWM